MKFSKWHALGNAYLLIQRAEAGGPLARELVERLCDVGTGVGADGVLEVVRASASEADIVVWNRDGSRAEFSGNGARIAAGWLSARSGRGEVRLHVGEREVVARRRGGAIELELGAVSVGGLEPLGVDGDELEFVPVSVGNPHAVFRRPALAGELDRYGPLIARHERFPAGTNVQFVSVEDRVTLRLEVWERGVGRTRSSGSSAVAAACAAVVHGWCEAPVTVRLPGAGELLVDLDSEGWVRLSGPVEEICRGEVSGSVADEKGG